MWYQFQDSEASSPPVRRITSTKDEEDNTMEYGLPSSHTLNTVCLSGVASKGLSKDSLKMLLFLQRFGLDLTIFIHVLWLAL
ncbi:hypothetical protein I3842_16G054900 [Carya illinoinensis]|uniref:Uncharacterized protein n=1 Tax=Carya illinoinensis TaxID=32201 RepID=A0A922A1U3_CARIL|nr:hypothetical protein I3842_16G054900 [Carya illinoinensis]KAG6672379.1 hypothetical protein I3842_16G054900 [Carya illinoinensis]KAG6672380.1 hypothetical protein I3842_16G054900 [Carya illinoinensis]KAG6672381.1 hypothetical protein I3842_16G054900 [Carya illinoinensis]